MLLHKRCNGGSLQPYHQAASRLVRKHAQDIRAVAAMLMAAGTVSGHTIASMLQPLPMPAITKRKPLLGAARTIFDGRPRHAHTA
jgi:hypothetical protein